HRPRGEGREGPHDDAPAVPGRAAQGPVGDGPAAARRGTGGGLRGGLAERPSPPAATLAGRWRRNATKRGQSLAGSPALAAAVLVTNLAAARGCTLAPVPGLGDQVEPVQVHHLVPR